MGKEHLGCKRVLMVTGQREFGLKITETWLLAANKRGEIKLDFGLTCEMQLLNQLDFLPRPRCISSIIVVIPELAKLSYPMGLGEK